MGPADLRRSAEGALPQPPPGLSGALLALWHDARGDWDRAHEAAQVDGSADGSWVHAYLHRKEGDPGNAAYWYSRARRPVSGDALEREWEAIAGELLSRRTPPARLP
jgi:hypothetical protein